MNSNTLIFGGLALTGLYLYNRYTQASGLIFYPGSISQVGFNSTNPQIQTSIIIQNTSNASFTIRSLAGNVYYDGTLVGNVSVFGNYEIGPNQQGQLPITIQFLLLSVINEIIDIVSNKTRVKPLTVEGSVNADGVQVPLKLTFNIGL